MEARHPSHTSEPSTTRHPRKRSDFAGLAWAGPALVLFLTFTIYPVIAGVGLSFFNAGIRHARWVGFRNYAQMATDPAFLQALGNTLAFAAVCVPVLVLVPLLIALVAQGIHRKLQGFLRFAYYLPALAAGTVINSIFLWVFHPDAGALNWLLGARISWLGRSPWAFVSVSIVLVSTGLGVGVLYFMAAMAGIDRELYDAAAVDGATWGQRARYVTIPELMPIVAFLSVVKTIGVLQLWNIPWMLTSGGPGWDTFTLAYGVYALGVQDGRYGYASAFAVVLLLVVLAFSLVQRLAFKGRA